MSLVIFGMPASHAVRDLRAAHEPGRDDAGAAIALRGPKKAA